MKAEYVGDTTIKGVPFWERKTFQEMSDAEWESLCDGCGRCCLIKYEDEDTGDLFFTNVACHLLDLGRCRCSHYEERTTHVPDCLIIRQCGTEVYRQLPVTCAYRIVFEGRKLPDWHPLVTGDARSTHDAGVSVCGKVISEEYIHPEQLFDHIISLD